MPALQAEWPEMQMSLRLMKAFGREGRECPAVARRGASAPYEGQGEIKPSSSVSNSLNGDEHGRDSRIEQMA
jgi:hypothetical protein